MPKSRNQKLKLLHLKRILEYYTDEDHGITTQEIRTHLKQQQIEVHRLRLYGYPQRDRRSGRTGAAAVSAGSLFRCPLFVLWTKAGQDQGTVLGGRRLRSAV